MPREGETAARDRCAGTVGTPGAEPLGFVIDATPFGVRAALAEITAALAELGVAGEEVGTVELVLAEIMNNITEHAYPEGAEGVIELDIDRDGAALTFKILDWGRPMPGGLLPEGRSHPENLPLESLPEGGFGWSLIRQLTEDLAYQRRGGANVLTFRVGLEAA